MKSNTPSVSLLGISFSNRSKEEIETEVRRGLKENRQRIIFTPNAEILYRASRAPSLAALLRSADLLLPDGVGVTLAARLRGTPLRARYAGIEMGEWLLRYSQENGLSVFLLGGKPGVAEQAKERLLVKLPDLKICGTHHGYFDKGRNSEENKRVLSVIQEKKPDLLFVCLGCPTQEEWIVQHTGDLPFLRLAIGLGGALDVWSGTQTRAPKFVQKTGFEWLWRALSSPDHLRRLPALPAFLWVALWERRKRNETQ